jgi:hypothetical protein
MSNGTPTTSRRPTVSSLGQKELEGFTALENEMTFAAGVHYARTRPEAAGSNFIQPPCECVQIKRLCHCHLNLPGGGIRCSRRPHSGQEIITCSAPLFTTPLGFWDGIPQSSLCVTISIVALEPHRSQMIDLYFSILEWNLRPRCGKRVERLRHARYHRHFRPQRA